MKKMATFLAALFIAGNISTVAYAEGENISTESKVQEQAGVTPDSYLYFLDRALDNLKVLLTFDDEQKMETIANIVEERLAESKVMTEKDKLELAKKALEDFNNKVEIVTERINEKLEANEEIGSINKISENNANEETNVKEEKTVDDEKQIQESEETTTGSGIEIDKNNNDIDKLLVEIEKYHEKALDVLNTIANKVDGNAKQNIENVIKMQKAKKESVMQMVYARHKLNEAKKEYKAAEALAKKSKIIGDEQSYISAKQKLEELKQTYKSAVEEYKNAFKNKEYIVKNRIKNKREKDYINKNLVVENKSTKDEVKKSEINNQEENIKNINDNQNINYEDKIEENENVDEDENDAVEESKTEQKKNEEIKNDKAKDNIKVINGKEHKEHNKGKGRGRAKGNKI